MMPNARRPRRTSEADWRTDAPLSTTGGSPQGRRRAGLGRDDLAQLARLLSYTKPYRRGLLAGIVAVAVAGGLGLLFPLIIRDLLNTAFAPGATRGTAAPALDRTALLLFGLMLVQAAFNYLRTYSLGRVGEAVVADLRKALFAHVLSLDVELFSRRKTGEITSRLTSDIATVQAAEPECRGIDLLEDAADPTRFMLVERWTSPEAFFGPHMQQPHLLAFIERAGTFLARPPDIALWRQVAGRYGELAGAVVALLLLLAFLVLTRRWLARLFLRRSRNP